MARDISIAISAKDNFSQAITTMRNANQSFNKDLTGLQTKLNELNKTKINLKVDTDKAKTALKDAEKQFAKTGEAADKLKLELANANYENVRRNMSLVSDNAKKAEKDIRSLTDAVSKSENKASKASGSTSILGNLGASGATSLVGNTLSSIGTSWVSSAYGSQAGTLVSDALSTGAMGAAIGSAIAPGIGTAIGGLGGTLLGLIQGKNSIFEEKDSTFKSYNEEAYNSAQDKQSQALTNGSDIAATRETNAISFATLLGGKKNGNKFLSSVTDFAQDTPFEYDDLTKISKTLLAYSYKQKEILPLLTKVGDAGSALGMNTEDMTFVATSLGRMKSTGKATLEYLNPLLERGIDVWSYLAEASGKTKKQVQEMVSKGLVPGEKAAEAIADYMGADFAGNMEKQSQTYSGLVSNLEDAQTSLDNSMGEGYNSTRKGGLQSQIDFLSGDSGKSMQEAYNKIGQWKASLENLSEQYQRDAVNSIMSGTIADSFKDSGQKEALERLAQEYSKAQAEYNQNVKLGDKEKAQEAGAEMGRVLAEAQVIATNEYNASEGAQLALQSNKTLADNIKNDTAAQGEYWNAGYTMGQQFTKGLASAISEGNKPVKSNLVNGSAISYNNSNKSDIKLEPYTGSIVVNGKSSSHAYGLNYVPYNDYPAMLHEGERVLTASENRNYGASPAITITGNNFSVREESDIPKVAQEIIRLMNQAYELAPQ